MVDILKDRIDKFELGYVFTVDSFHIEVKYLAEVSRILSAFVKEGYLCKLSKGKYYKPKMSKFGELPPDIYQIVKDLIKKDGKLTGLQTWNIQQNITNTKEMEYPIKLP